jgi:hypothetical protein
MNCISVSRNCWVSSLSIALTNVYFPRFAPLNLFFAFPLKPFFCFSSETFFAFPLKPLFYFSSEIFIV